MWIFWAATVKRFEWLFPLRIISTWPPQGSVFVCVHFTCTENQLFQKQWTIICATTTTLTAECVLNLCRVKAGFQHYTILEHHEDTVNQFTAATLLLYKYPFIFLSFFFKYFVSFFSSTHLPHKYTRSDTKTHTLTGVGLSQDETTSPTLPTMCRSNKTLF